MKAGPSQPPNSPPQAGALQNAASLARFRSAEDPTSSYSMKRSIASVDDQSPTSAATTPGAPRGKMELPPLKRVRNDSAVTNGPVSRDFTLKPRPRPGRKPITGQEDSSDKRKTQNREAQRAFRDRRAQKCKELEEENAELKETHAAALQELYERIANLEAEKNYAVARESRAIAELTERNERLQRALDAANAEANSATAAAAAAAAAAQTQRSFMTSNSVSSVHQILTPPSDSSFEPHDQLELDFTNYGKPSTFTHVPEDDHCGFCSDVENCICRQQQEINHKSLPPIDSSRATTQPKAPTDVSTPSFLEAPTNASGPGTCDMCLADPEKARQCRELAEATVLKANNNKTFDTVPIRRPNRGNSTKQAERTSCSDFLQQAQQQNVKLGPEDYSRIGNHVYRVQRPAGRSEHSPFMEMDAQDAALTLAALSRQDTRSAKDRHV